MLGPAEMSLFSFLFPKKSPSWHAIPTDPKWRRDSRGRFFRLNDVNVDQHQLRGCGGVYVLWHGGIRPRWVHVAAADDLAQALEAARADPDISRYDVNGGLFTTWASVRRDYRAGVVVYLRGLMCPIIQPSPSDRSDEPVEVVPVLMPL
ncbi:MAG: hypothetical protein H7840_12195 [Alphaproteobacteria bacterium]